MYNKITGTVIKGKGLGKTIGFPTANIIVEKLSIEDGVYKLKGVVDGKLYSGVGVFFGKQKLFEPHFFNLDKDLYGKKIEVIIFYKIRENKKFNSLEELKLQIKKDVKIVKSSIDYAITFGTFDILHPGHKYYLNQAKQYGDKLITIVARDKNVEKIKGIKPLNNETHRLEKIKKLAISDIVQLGCLDDHLKWIEEYKPKVICLGYDQKGFIKELEKNITKLNFDIKIVRISPYKENQYKSSILRDRK